VSPILATNIGALIVAIIATITDIRTTKIYNVLTFPAMLIGIIVRSVQYAMMSPDKPVVAAIAGCVDALLGWVIGMLTLGIFKMTIMRKFGGGDIKLMGAIGAFTGPAIVFSTFMYYGLAFGLYTCTVMLLAFPWQQYIAGMQTKDMNVVDWTRFNQVRKAPLPVAPFILLGLVVTLVFYQATMQLFGVTPMK
jgi:prepilin peptidase CpaA